MKRPSWLHFAQQDEVALLPYRVRADAIMVGTNLFMALVCLGVAAFNGSWAPALSVGLPTLWLSWWLQRHHSGQLATRLFMACAFMTYTSLLIHQSGGDIEAHFSAFGLIGVLLYYRDWRTIAAATGFIYLQHLVGGYAQTRGLPIYVFDTLDFWPTFALHVAYFLPFVGMMGFLSIWLWREGVEQQRIIEAGLQNEQTLREVSMQADVANRLKGQFLANMSHEIRTPLNGVMGMLQLVQDSPLTPWQQEQLQVARESSEHLLVLLNDILDISRIEAGALELSREPTSVRQLLSSLQATLGLDAQAKGLSLDIVCDGAVPPWLLLDATRLRQICTNLINNAIQYTPSGWVRVTARTQAKGESPDRWLCIEVRDSGKGFPADMAESIFSPFVQGDSSYTRTHGGAGLGLAITRGLVQLMGGTIRAEAETGVGASFTVNVPCTVQMPHAPVASVVSASATKADKALQILVAEDHPVNQKIMEQMLRKLGHVPTLVADGAQALEQLGLQTFDLLLLDMMMPKLDGLQVLSRWRSQEAALKTHMPIVMVTAYAMTGDAEKFLAAGADGYLPKPVSLERLSHEIMRQVPAARPLA